MEKIDLAIGRVLKRIRLRQGLSQEELSFDATLHRTYISQLERGLKSITVKKLVQITNVLNITIDCFMKEVMNELDKL